MANHKVHKSKGKSFSAHKFGSSTKNFHMERKKEVSEKKRIEKAKMLRDYARLCKREGIDSDRVHIGPKASADQVAKSSSSSSDSNENRNEVEAKEEKKKIKKPSEKKINPFMHEQRKAQAERSKIEDAHRAGKDVKKEMEQKRAQRNIERKKHLGRTKRGQPIMANQIQSLLGKLKSSGAVGNER